MVANAISFFMTGDQVVEVARPICRPGTRAREEAQPLTLNEGETKSVDVKLSKLTP